MDVKVFDNDYLHKHSLWVKCPSTLNEVSERDYRGKNYFDTRIDCLDMDTYERQVCGGQADCTTDAVIGISDCQNKKKSYPRLLLVELRMGYKSRKKLDKSNLEKKIKHTKSLLGSELPIDRKSWFVFTENVAPQARRWVSDKSKEGGEVANIEVYSVQEFANNICCFEELDYTPENSPEEIKRRFEAYVSMQDWNGLFGYVRYWKDFAECNRRSNVYEYQNVKNIMLESWNAFYSKELMNLNGDAQLDAMILDEDLKNVLRQPIY